MSFGMMGGLGGPGSATGRFSSTRGRIQNSVTQGVNYPSPFFDIAHTYLPTTVKQMFRWCRYYFLTNPLINATCFKLSEYPITELLIDHANPMIRKKWEEFFNDHLRFRPFQIECGLDYHVYGNSMVSLGFPFHKYLKCQFCNFSEKANKIRNHWTFTNFAFRMNCPKCGSTGEAIPKDFYYKDAGGIRPIRWNCENIEVNYNELSGESTYFYTIPANVRNDVMIGKKDVVEGVPQIFIQSMRERKGIVFAKDNFFHMKRPTLAEQDRGWGIPVALPVLKDIFYLQLMKKATEQILVEHIVPLRILFPQAGSSTSDPYCVSPETLVETPVGLLPACEIKPGDFLRSHTGAWREVQYTKARAVKDSEKVYRFKIASLAGFPFEVSEEHPILGVKRTGGCQNPRNGLVDPSFIEAQNLQKGDYVAYPVKRIVRGPQELDLSQYLTERAVTETWVYRRLGQQAAEIYEWLEQNGKPMFAWGERKTFLAERGWNESDFATAYAMLSEEGIDRIARYLPVNKSLATIIGFYISEGFVGTGGLVKFALNINEGEYASILEKAVLSLGFRGVSHRERPSQSGREVHIEDVLLSELLVALCGKGFASKRIPDVMSEAEDSIVREMLWTIFVGDGCDFKTSTNRVALKLANPSVILEVRRLLLSFGFIGGVMREDPTEDGISKAPSYHLNYNGQAANELRTFFHNGIPQIGPQRNGLFRGDYVLLTISEIEEVSTVPTVIGFQMAEDKSFCVAGVATHNTSINLIDWKEHVAAEISRWRMDQNYIPILPLPIGNQTLGGDGKSLLMTAEMQEISVQIMAGLGVPREFIQGGLSYSGSNVSMRMLENQFLGYILRQQQMATWIMKHTASYMGWPEVGIRFRPFKMADDIQRKAYLFQLNQANKISDSTLLADVDLDQNKEDETMLGETSRRLNATKKQQLAMAEIQGEAQVIMAKSQAKAQQTMMTAQATGAAQGEPGDALSQMGSPLNLNQSQGAAPAPGGQAAAGIDIQQMAQMLSQQILSLPPQDQELALSNLKAQSPELAQLVEQLVAQQQPEVDPSMGMGAQGAAATTINQQPLPDARAPRRAAATV